MMFFDLERIRANVRQAETEDLLDRVTVYRPEMEDAALVLIEEELRSRGVTSREISVHEEQRRRNLLLVNGHPLRCCDCYCPAVIQVAGWHWIWGLVPLFRRSYYYCAEHQPRGA
jgi:hypothetical protein